MPKRAERRNPDRGNRSGTEAAGFLADDTLALEEPTEASPAADTPVRVFIVLSGKSALEQGYAASAMAEATAYTGRLLNRQAAVIETLRLRC